jgi:hypothetical protein
MQAKPSFFAPFFLTISVRRAGVERPPKVRLEAILDHPVREVLLDNSIFVVAASAPLSHHHRLARAFDEPAELEVPYLGGKQGRKKGREGRQMSGEEKSKNKIYHATHTLLRPLLPQYSSNYKHVPPLSCSGSGSHRNNTCSRRQARRCEARTPHDRSAQQP